MSEKASGAKPANKGANKSSNPVNKVFIGLAFLLFVMVCIAYANHFNNPFQYDDGHAIVNNYYLRDLKNIPLFFKDAVTSCTYAPNQIYRPLNTTLNAIDCAIGGKGMPVPFYYHCSIFITFLILGVFIYLFSIKIYNVAFQHRLNTYIALLTTAVFMLHTATSETINYIYERSDLASTLMVLVALCVFTYDKHLRKYQIYIIPMVLGLLIKEPAVMVAPFAFLYMFLFEENLGFNKLFSSTSLKLLVKVAPAFVIAAVVFLFEQQMSPSRWAAGSYLATSADAERIPYLLTQPMVMIHYFNNYIFPVNLSADSQDWEYITNPFDERVVFPVMFICFTLYLAYKASLQTKTRPIAFGILWFYLALAPNSSIIPFPEVIRDLRTFFAFIGLTIAVVWALFLLYTKYETIISKNAVLRGSLIALMSIFFIAHTYGVRQRVKVWSTEESLWKDVTEKSPNNGRALMFVGKDMMERGEYKGALDYLTRAEVKWPTNQYIQLNLGVLYNELKNTAKSDQAFKNALQFDPQNPDCFAFYGVTLISNGRIAEARDIVDRGLRFNPNHPDLLKMKAQLSSMGNVKSKLETLEESVKLHPTADDYINLSVEYYNNARYADCIHAAEEALKLHPDFDLAYSNICAANNALHDWDKAIAAGQKAVSLSPNTELYKNNLKIAYDGKEHSK